MDIQLEEVFEAYYACRKNKRHTANQLSFEVNYESNLVQLWKELNNRTYEIGRSIAFVVTRPKYREVFAADFRDRIVHHLLIHKLEPLFEQTFIDDNYNCRKNKGTLYGVQRLRDKIVTLSENYTKPCYVLKCDMQGFFMSIDKRILWEKLEAFINKNYHDNDKDFILWITKKIVFNCP